MERVGRVGTEESNRTLVGSVDVQRGTALRADERPGLLDFDAIAAVGDPVPDAAGIQRGIISITDRTRVELDARRAEDRRAIDFRLDTKDGAFAERPGGTIIVPGDSSASRLYTRISHEKRALQMPPPGGGEPLTPGQILLIAAASSVGEEAFFRGAVQPWLGLPVTSVVFGLLHVGPSRVFLPWTTMALIMGFALGLLFSWTGSLIAPVLCHGLINAINLRRIALRARADFRAP